MAGRIQAAHLAHRCRQRSLGRIQLQARIAIVQLYQQLSFGHRLCGVGINGGYRAAGLRHHRDDVAAHIGVVGAGAPLPDKKPPQENAKQDKQHRAADEQQDLAAPAVVGARGSGGLIGHDGSPKEVRRTLGAC